MSHCRITNTALPCASFSLINDCLPRAFISALSSRNKGRTVACCQPPSQGTLLPFNKSQHRHLYRNHHGTAILVWVSSDHSYFGHGFTGPGLTFGSSEPFESPSTHRWRLSPLPNLSFLWRRSHSSLSLSSLVSLNSAPLLSLTFGIRSLLLDPSSSFSCSFSNYFILFYESFNLDYATTFFTCTYLVNFLCMKYC